MPGNQVAQRTPDTFSDVLLARVRNVSLSNTGDVLVNGQPLLPITENPQRYTVRRITVSNGQVSGVSGSIAAALFGIFTAAGASGTVAANQAISVTGTSGANGAQDLTLTNSTTTVLTAGALYLNVGTAVANGTCDICIYGSVLLA